MASNGGQGIPGIGFGGGKGFGFSAGGGGGASGPGTSGTAGGAGGTGGGGFVEPLTGIGYIVGAGGDGKSGLPAAGNYGGGGGGGDIGGSGVAGQKGIVIISYFGSQRYNGGDQILTVGPNTVHIFLNTGNLTLI